MIYIVIPSPDMSQAIETGGEAMRLCGVPARLHIEPDPDRTGYTASVNRGLRAALADPEMESACVLVDDAIPITEYWLRHLRAALIQNANYGFAGPSGPCRTAPQNTGKVGMGPGVRIVEHVAGFCVLVRRAVLETTGLMDEGFRQYGSDVDWQWRAKRGDGWDSVWVRHVYVSHEVHPFKGPWGQIDGDLMRQRWGRS